MAFRDLVIQSQLIPPLPRKAILPRPRIRSLLQRALQQPLTLLLAGTGYGKSTALLDLREEGRRIYWYTVNEPDRDPLVFLIHLINAFAQQNEDLGRDALRYLEEHNGRAVPAALTPLLNALTAHLLEESVLVIDDYHWVHDVPEIAALVRHLFQYRPPRLQVVLSTRVMPENLDLNRWRVKGELSLVTHSELAFTAEEIEALFREGYGFPITLQQAARLAEETEGWALALQLIWQSVQRQPSASLDAVLENLPETLESLFDYLAPEVFARQAQDIQQFLLSTSILRQLEGEICDSLLGIEESANVLRRLYEGGMFIEAAGGQVYRYQRLFQEFLQTRLNQYPDEARALHLRAATLYLDRKRSEEAIYHLLKAGETAFAADVIEQIGMGLIRSGRLESLQYYLGRLPSGVKAERPLLQLLLGDLHRLRADFEPSLAHFRTAEQLYRQQGDRWGCSRALRGQAQVYLDTIRPLQADSLLEEALRLLEPQEYREEVAALLDQLAENKLNLGKPDEARILHREAQLLRAETSPNDVYLEGRALLRTGRLIEARQLMLNQAAEERRHEAQRAQRFHRETLLLLSLICSMLGSAAEAERYAREGIAIGRRLQSEFVEAVGLIRLGHALQIGHVQPWGEPYRRKAVELYRSAIELMHPFKVARVGVEPLWGLTRALGYAGELAEAEECASRALAISEKAGDEWIGNLVRTSMGASFALAGQFRAARTWLERAALGFDSVRDRFGWTAARLWLAWMDWYGEERLRALAELEQIFEKQEGQDTAALFTAPTLLGWKDEQTLVPLLLAARRAGIGGDYILKLLMPLTVEGDYHPAYTLYVRTLSDFAVWRGDVKVQAAEWQREKARQLFQLLITHRQRWLLRDQIVDLLWPELDGESAVRDFKVALNALNRTIEPQRPREAIPFFVRRHENAYGINPQARVVVDADEFERLAANNLNHEESLRQALDLYQNDYLHECCYEDWSSIERERLRQVYFDVVQRLGELLGVQGRWDEVIAVCNTALMRDHTWEPGYRLIMRAYAARGNQAQVIQTYQRCWKILWEELGVEPSLETRDLLRRLTD
ncbi:MAG: transcriptional activator [Bellilinea sp.]|nr:MAG: transcriptional activator [Bellilinea sp.]